MRLGTALFFSLLTVGLGLSSMGCPSEEGGGGQDAGAGQVDAGTAQDAGGGKCQSDLDCPGGSCNLLTAACEQSDAGVTDGGQSDAGADGGVLCTPNDARCTQDGVTLEVCAPDGTRWRSAACPSQVPVCAGSDCVVCAPGLGECQGSLARVCRADGSGFDETDCGALGGSCNGGTCLLCQAGAVRCDSTSLLQTCDSTGTGWIDTDCGAEVCDAAAAACIPVSCTPATLSCQGDLLKRCNAAGDAFVLDTDCAAAGGLCQVDQCVNLCAQAVQNNSYIGCDYWPVILSNAGLSPSFRSEFAVVVANPNAGTVATINVYAAGVTSPVATTQVLGGALDTITLPWNAMDAVVNGASTTERGATAYHLVSNVPVTAYQFNPLPSRLPSGCTQDSDCPSFNAFTPGSGCEAGPAPRACGYDDYSYTNDASLLLPAHIFADASGASGYMAVSPAHQWVSSFQGSSDGPAFVAIVGTEDATTVTFTSAGATAAGGGQPTLDPGAASTITLAKGEVLQIASRQFGTPDETSPFLSGLTFRRYPAGDLTGSVITSDKPVAVYSGADCQNVPFDKQACDHLEQQLFPFSNWGSRYVAAHAEYPNNTAGDIWRVVSGADGTLVTFTPASVHAATTLNRGQWLELSAPGDFAISSQDLTHPIMVVQFFKGIEAVNPLSTGAKTDVGDPSMVLSIPVEQYRDAYTFTTPSTIARDFITVVRPTGAVVTLDASPMNTSWSPLPGGGFEVGRLEISDGTHRLQANQAVGLSVYGFDWSVSYGYPGGLDLKSIVVIAPGG